MQLASRQATTDDRQPMNDHYETVLVLLDGSPAGADCLPAALDLARQSLARLMLLRVIDPEGAEGHLTDASQTRREGRREFSLRRSRAEGYLDAIKRWLGTHGVNVEARVEEGEPGAVLLRLALVSPRPVVVIRDAGPQSESKGWLDELSQKLAQADVPVLVIDGF
jgi:nucleotide-binding universal stress UspA family protein